jgi:hypothetical protein
VLKQIATRTFVPTIGATDTVNMMQSRELVEPYQGGYRFQVPLMQRWVLHRMQVAQHE